MRIQHMLAGLLACAAVLIVAPGAHSAPFAQSGAASSARAVQTLITEGGAFSLVLAPNGRATLTELAPATDEQPASWTGTWRKAAGDIYIRLLATDSGAALKQPIALEGVIAGNEFDIAGIGVDDLIYDRNDLDFTLGSGQRHPFVRVINQLLSELPYLNYTYPQTDDNLYTEAVRRAVAQFQEVEGYMPSGLIDLRTLLALVTPTQPRLDVSRIEFTVAPKVANVRSGPSTNYPVIQRVYQGNTFEVVGKVGDGDPRSTWLEVCCLSQQNGWIRGDLGTITGDLVQVNVVPTDQLLPEPAPVAVAPAAPRSQPLLASLPSTTPDGAPIVYFTFDDGPNGSFTSQVMDLMKQYSGKATFFIIGRQARGGSDVLRRMATEGHYLGNHTWDHVWLDRISKEEFVNQIQRTRNELVSVAGDLFTLDRDVLYVRPPYGAINANDRQWMAELGMTPVLWDVDPQDWRRPGVDTVANHVINNVFPGAVVLMHDGGGERTQSVAALEKILPELSAKGYRFYNIFGK